MVEEVKEIKVEEVEKIEEEREYADAFTVEQAEKNGLSMLEYMKLFLGDKATEIEKKLKGSPIRLDWTVAIQIPNYMMTKGDPLTKQDGAMKVLKAFQISFPRFLGQTSPKG